jgi:molecular chaperone DnaJ
MTRLRSGNRGDFYIHIGVEIPTKLSKEESELLARFAEVHDDASHQGKRTQISSGQSQGLFSRFKEAFRG